jgi:hypothetical protein
VCAEALSCDGIGAQAMEHDEMSAVVPGQDETNGAGPGRDQASGGALEHDGMSGAALQLSFPCHVYDPFGSRLRQVQMSGGSHSYNRIDVAGPKRPVSVHEWLTLAIQDL